LPPPVELIERERAIVPAIPPIAVVAAPPAVPAPPKKQKVKHQGVTFRESDLDLIADMLHRCHTQRIKLPGKKAPRSSSKPRSINLSRFPKVPSIRLLVWLSRSVKDPGKGSRRRSRWEGPGVPRVARNRPTASPISEGGSGGNQRCGIADRRTSGAEFARSPPTRRVRRSRNVLSLPIWCSPHVRSSNCWKGGRRSL
jgi:hypothetical protein